MSRSCSNLHNIKVAYTLFFSTEELASSFLNVVQRKKDLIRASPIHPCQCNMLPRHGGCSQSINTNDIKKKNQQKLMV